MNKLFNNIYKGKKVLITGHTGFKGSWLALWLSKLGAEVVGYSIDIPTKPNHFELLNLNIESVTGDVLDKKKLFETIEKHKPEIVFHMAAQSLVKESYEYPVETIETNIIGTANLLESCRQAKCVKAIVNITSDKCYKNQEWEWGYRESDHLGGSDPYSASKGCAELVANAYRESFFNPNNYNKDHSTLLASVRAGNVIGGGDWAKDRLIPDIMRATAKGEEVLIRMPGAIRPWQHVLEPLSGYLQLGWRLLEGKKEFADDWNFGPSEESSLSVKLVSLYAQNYWSEINFTIKEGSNDAHETNLLRLDSAKAHQKLNWKNVWNDYKAIEQTIRWYSDYYKNNTITSENDLNNYIKDAQELSLVWAKT